MTTKHKGMVITILLVLLSSSPLFSEEPVAPPGYVIYKEDEFEQIIRDVISGEIEAAVTEAVAIVVKEEEKKRIDLQVNYDSALDRIEALEIDIKNLKRNQVKNIMLWTGGGVVVGFSAGVITLLLIQAGK